MTAKHGVQQGRAGAREADHEGQRDTGSGQIRGGPIDPRCGGPGLLQVDKLVDIAQRIVIPEGLPFGGKPVGLRELRKRPVELVEPVIGLAQQLRVLQPHLQRQALRRNRFEMVPGIRVPPFPAGDFRQPVALMRVVAAGAGLGQGNRIPQIIDSVRFFV